MLEAKKLKIVKRACELTVKTINDMLKNMNKEPKKQPKSRKKRLKKSK